MIKKIYVFIILFFLGLNTQSQAYDCYFDKLKPGATKKDLEKINIFAYGPSSESGLFTRVIQAQDICKNSYKDEEKFQKIMGLNIYLIFIKEKLVKVNYINGLNESATLFDILVNDYKINIQRNKEQVEKKQSEFYNATLNNNSYFYVLLKNKETQQEYLEIISDRDSEKLNENLLKMEETQ